MRCKSCDRRLNDFETTRKYLDLSYVDLCNTCFKLSGYKGGIIENFKHKTPYDEEDYLEDIEDEDSMWVEL